MYVLIEMADVELLGVRLYTDREQADKAFAACRNENELQEYVGKELAKETAGTLRLAGDDAYSVQLLEVEA